MGEVLFQAMGPVVGEFTVDGQDDVFLSQFAVHWDVCLTFASKVDRCGSWEPVLSVCVGG